MTVTVSNKVINLKPELIITSDRKLNQNSKNDNHIFSNGPFLNISSGKVMSKTITTNSTITIKCNE